MRGDILLFRGEGLRDRYVCAYTGGPYCHCEIDLGDGSSVGIHMDDGLTYRWNHLPERRETLALSATADPERIEAGIAWVLERLGERMSWASLADLAMPRWLSTMIFGRRSQYNCANLVAYYVDITGGLPLSCGKCPPLTLSPNDIARAAGLLPPNPAASHGGIRRLFFVLPHLFLSAYASRYTKAPSP